MLVPGGRFEPMIYQDWLFIVSPGPDIGLIKI